MKPLKHVKTYWAKNSTSTHNNYNNTDNYFLMNLSTLASFTFNVVTYLTNCFQLFRFQASCEKYRACLMSPISKSQLGDIVP